jgi:cation diffusion facilitator family transporter
MDQPDTVDRRRSATVAASVSMLVAVAMVAIKLGAYAATQSTAILSDALESVVHVGATAFMYYCVRVSQRPPDENHPYGHGKVEYFSVGFEGGMVALAALAIFWQAGLALWQGQPLRHTELGFALTAGAAAINVALGVYLRLAGRRTGSLILLANGKHVLSDVWTSAGALIGVGAVMLTGIDALDSIVAILLGIFILVTAITLIRQAVRGLMDHVDRALIERVVTAITEIREEDWLDVHNLRLRSSGAFTYIDFHLVVPRNWTVERGHDAVDRLEHHILERLGSEGAVMIHLDYPKGDHQGRVPITAGMATRIGPAVDGA